MTNRPSRPLRLRQPSRSPRVAPLAGVLTAVLAPVAVGAELPGVLAHTPADAPVVITLNDPKSAADRAIALLGEMPGDGAVQARAVLSVATVAMFLPGLDASGSFAVAIYPPAPGPDGRPDPDAFPAPLIIAPVTNYNALRGGLRLQERDGIAELGLAQLMGGGMPGGDAGSGSVYVKDIPGPYVACALDRETLRAFEPAPNADAAPGWTAHLDGPAAEAVGATDIAILVSPRGASDAFAGLGGLEALPLPGMGLIPGGGAGQEEAIGTASGMFEAIVDALGTDGRAGVIGLKLTDDDLAVELAAGFDAGSATGAMLTAGGDGMNGAPPDAGAVLAWLPEGPALMNASADLRHAPTRRTVMDWLGQLAGTDPFVAAMLPAGAGPEPTGHAVHIGLSPAALGGAGILGQAVAVSRFAGDADGELVARRERLAAFDGVEQSGVALAFTTGEGDAAAEALGAGDALPYRLRAAIAPDAGAEANTVMAGATRLHGRAGGPGGIIAGRDDAVIVTTGRSTAFLGRIGDAVGRDAGVNDSGVLDPIAAAAGQLPAAPGALMTIDLDAARTLAGEFAPIVLAPYGGRNAELGTVVGALVTGDAGARFQLRVPRKTAVIVGDLMLSQLGNAGPGGFGG